MTSTDAPDVTSGGKGEGTLLNATRDAYFTLPSH